MKSVAIAGGSGLIGQFLLKSLVEDNTILEIYYLGRSAPKSSSDKITFIDINKLSSEKDFRLPEIATSFCCLGTTMKTAGSKEAFEAVDYEMVLDFAKASKLAHSFMVVSALGASSDSKVYYSSIKGKMEKAIQSMGFAETVVLRPSILTGPRKEFRLGERIGIAVMSLLSPLMLGSLKKYRPIPAKTVAKAMLNCHYQPKSGNRIIEGNDILLESRIGLY